MSRTFVALDARARAGVSRLGGKGHNLLRLLNAGFAVPPGFVVPAPWHRDWRRAPAPTLARLRPALARALAALPAGSACAVRSSAIAEDGATASFAGQYRTVLDVRGLDAVTEAVVACWQSAANGAAQVYRRRHGGNDDAMAVVVQCMVPARWAGVLFTRHPVRPDLDRVAVEAVAGLGEALVSGQRHPARLELRRGGGRALCEGPADAAAAFAAVGDEQWLELARRLETLAGCAQDAEWAHDGQRLWVLQTRPITTINVDADVWTRTWGDEFWAEATTPLQYDFLGRWIREDYFHAVARIHGWHHLLAMEPFTRRHGHVYFNARYMRALLPLMPPELRLERHLNWLPPQWRADLATVPYWRWRSMLAPLRARLKDPAASVVSHHRRLAAYTTHVATTCDPNAQPAPATLDDTALWTRLERNDALGRAHFRFIRWGLGTYLFPLRLVVERLSHDWAGVVDPAAIDALLSAGDGATQTTAMARDLQALAARAEFEPALRARFTASSPPSPSELAGHPGGTAFLAELAAFLARYGHRGTTRELRDPRWAEAPELVLALVAAHVAAGGGASRSASPHTPALADPAASWLSRIAAAPGGPWKRPVASAVLALARSYVRYREDQRFALDYILSDMRRVLLEIARRLVQRDRLRSADDLFFLTFGELQALWHEGVPPGGDLAARRDEFERDRATLPPDWIVDGIGYRGDTADAVPGDGLHGTAAAPGRAHGVVRVVRSPSELGRVRAGDVLVAPNTDPGWTPVFPLLKGLVLETGGVLSHGAIVAREFGLPAVTGVSGACNTLRDGDPVTVDGSRGVVIRNDPAATNGD